MSQLVMPKVDNFTLSKRDTYVTDLKKFLRIQKMS